MTSDILSSFVSLNARLDATPTAWTPRLEMFARFSKVDKATLSGKSLKNSTNASE